ncbi:MAG TPA: efflux transporter outer membrane subunit [Croceibacterium sp.]|nr:efflux transporter outer membrane subunit [Croceibacterium sp.]
MTEKQSMPAARLAAVLLTTVVAGCTVGPDYRPPSASVSEAWIGPAANGEVDAAWWTRFDDPLLSQLVSSAVAGNKDLAEASARLREARAARDATYGRAEPQAGASAAVTRNRLSENGLLPVGRVPGLGPDLSLYDIGFDASWELDLWGGTRRAIEGADARAQAAEEAHRAVVIQVIAEVVRSYIALRSAQGLRDNAIKNAEIQTALARLVADRARAGSASRFDVARAEALARSSAASVPRFESDATAAAFRIALLLGQPPEALYDRLRASGSLPQPVVEVGAGLRSDLLRRRPDIRQAERELAASTADIGVATAELFPHLSLLGGSGLQSRTPGDLLSADSLRFQFGPSLHWPIFSGGRIRAQIRAADARADAAMARYERAVLAALSDTETALNQYASAGEARAERDAARSAAAEAVTLARTRYLAGEDDLTALLLAQAEYNAAEQQSIQALATQLQNVAALYKALGGGWEAVEASTPS